MKVVRGSQDRLAVAAVRKGKKSLLVLSEAASAVGAQITQAAASFVLMFLAARMLGLRELGQFSILYGILVMATAVSSGFVGDTLTVLDRHHPTVRTALQRFTVGICSLAALLAALTATVTGLVRPLEALVFAGALAIFMIEDLLRRLLMANMNFLRIMAVDTTSVGFSLLTLFAWSVLTDAGPGRSGPATDQFTLLTFLVALAVGQFTAAALAICIVPKSERYFAKGKADYLAVFRYGAWRAVQQVLRPSLLTATRIAVVLAVSLAAAGELEIARIYSAPVLLLVGGLSSFLFASFAKQRSAPTSDLLKQADRGVLFLLTVTVPGSVLALAVISWAGPLLTGHTPDVISVAGWLAFGVSVGGVTPYGALGAVRLKPSQIFVIRSADTALSLITVAVVLAFTGDFSLASGSLVGGSLLGGLAIRRLLVVSERAGKNSGVIENAPA